MTVKYLVGPLSAEEAWRSWQGPRRRGDCRAFNARNNLDLTLAPADRWEDVCRRLPPDWRPDFIVLDLAFGPVPACLWQAPVPLVGLARGWEMRWHAYRGLLPHCDVVLADAPGAQRLRRAGVGHARPANLCGLGPDFLGLPADGRQRDIDVLFAGTCLAPWRWRRLAWLGRLAAQGRWRLAFRQGVPPAEYRDLLRRARVVFNVSDHGACNRRAFEAAAAGALLVQEAGNAELPHYLTPGTEYVPYTDTDLEDRLEHYLTHEAERLAIAGAAQRRVQGYGCDALWQEALGRLEAEWEAVQERCQKRRERKAGPDPAARVWAALGGEPGGDPRLAQDLTEAVARAPADAALHHGLGVARFLEARAASRPSGEGAFGPFKELAWSAAPELQRALAANPRHAVAAAALVEVLATDPKRAAIAATGAQQVLALLDSEVGPDPASLEAPPLSDNLLLLHAEWERAAWENAGDPAAEGAAKVRLLRWRMHTLLGRLREKQPEHFQQAAAQRPDLPTTQAALGCALADAGRLAEAIAHFQRELATNPFDAAAARFLFRALAATGRYEDSAALVRQRQRLRQAAPQFVPAEPWFTAPPPARAAARNGARPTGDHPAQTLGGGVGEPPPRPQRQAPAAVPAPPHAPGKRMKVSLCLIVKDEEHNLRPCLESITDLVDEVVVVDTGSTDRTQEVAGFFGAKVFDFPWRDSFAAARNEAISHASGDWIFWLDADDRLDAENRRKLHALFAGLRDENAAYALKCLCLPDPSSGAATVVDHVRLFRNDPRVRWRYRVHEQILPAIREAGGEVRFADVVIHHTGYQDPALRRRKLDRDLRLLHLEDAERPDDPFTLFNLGSVTQELGRHAEALPLLRRSLAKSGPRDSIVRKLYALIVGCHRALNQLAEAEAACAAGLAACPNDTELLFLDSILRKDRGDLAGSEACLLRLLHEGPGAHFASLDAGLRGHKARHNLGVLYLQQGRLAEAQAQWRAAAAQNPEFLPAWLGWGECCLRSGNLDGLEAAARRLEDLPGGRLEATLLRARGLMARREFAGARALLEAACAASPQAVAPRVLLSHALLQEGRDVPAAEAALREVLRLEPGNAEARHNRELLLGQNGALPPAAPPGAEPAAAPQPDAVVPADGQGGAPGGGAAPGTEGEG